MSEYIVDRCGCVGAHACVLLADISTLAIVAENSSAHSNPPQCIRNTYTRVNAIAFSPDRTTIVSGSDDGSIRLWGELLGTRGVWA